MSPLVGINVIVVPDGVRSVDGRRRCRLSLSLTPNVTPAPGEGFDLAEWPAQVAKRTARIRVAVGHLVASGTAADASVTVSDCAYLHDPGCPDVGDLHVSDATNLWQRIFGGEPGFKLLYDTLKNNGSPSRGEDDDEPKPTPAVGNYHLTGIASAIDMLQSAALTTTVGQRALSLGSKGTIDTRFDACRPGLGWWREVRDNWLAPVPETLNVSTLGSLRRLPAEGDAITGQVLQEMKGAAKAMASGSDEDVKPYLDGPARMRALADVAAFMERRIGDVPFWRTGRLADGGILSRATSSETSAQDSRSVAFTLKKELTRFDACWGTNETRVVPPKCKIDKQDELNAAARKLSGILSHPTLAKFLRLIVDVEIDWSSIEKALRAQPNARTLAAIAVDLTTPPPSGADLCAPTSFNWTAFAYDPAGPLPAYFGPCSKADIVGQPPATHRLLRDGLVNLAMQLNEGSRFALTLTAVTNTVLEFQQAALTVDETSRKGALPAEQSNKLPAGETRGIALCDRLLKDDHLSKTSKERARANTVIRISYAEDLLQGYRIDVALLKKTALSIPAPSEQWHDRWRTLMARDLSYTNDAEIPRAFRDHEAVTRVADREDGHVRAAVGTMPIKETPLPGGSAASASQRAQTSVSEELFTWTGESLGVPSMHHGEGAREVQVCGDRDLAIARCVDSPKAVAGRLDRRPPPLREGRSYMFGARACFLNGCGVPLEDAISRYVGDQPSLLLGDNGRPFSFVRRGELPAPDVLLAWDEPLVTAGDLSHAAPGETVDTLVIRDSASRMTTRRFLVPARASFETCELAGTFDHVDNPTGAFTGEVKVALGKTTGSFPVARDGKWEFTEPNDEGKKRVSRGSVLVLDPDADVPDVPNYPDPLTARVHARFVRNGEDAPRAFKSATASGEFWPVAGSPSKAAPMLVELAPASDRERGSITFERDVPVAPRKGRAVRLPKLTIRLARAEDIQVELWPDHDPQQLHDVHWGLRRVSELLPKHIDGLAAGLTDGLAKGDAISLKRALAPLLGRDLTARNKRTAELLALAPLGQIVNRRTVRVVHAVEKPMEKPRFIALHPIVVTVAPEAAEPDGSLPPHIRSWSKYVDAQQTLHPDQKDWPSEPGGSTTFFVGQVAAHRLSTGIVRCHAQWSEFDPVNLSYDTDLKRWVFPTPSNAAPLFHVDRIRCDDRVSLDSPIDLLLDEGPFKRNELTPLRGLSYRFRDGRARRLSVGLVATSRFVPFFPPSSPGPAVGRHDVQSATEKEVWVPATSRPSAPIVDRVLPVFAWCTEPPNGRGGAIKWTREPTLRVYLKDWYSSGEGEKLAVAFGPFADGNGKPFDFVSFERAFPEFANFVTRWGADIIHRSGCIGDMQPGDSDTACRLDELIPPDAFHDYDGEADHQGPIPNLQLPYGHPATVDQPIPQPTEGVVANKKFRVRGAHFLKGLSAWINKQQVKACVVDDTTLDLVSPVDIAPPIVVEVENPTLTVSILTYSPEFDETEGLWYCDIAIDHKKSYFPFVQLGLARYQPHSVKGLELSQPLAVWAQIPPRRDGEVTIARKTQTLVLEHHGVGFDRSDAGPDHVRLRHLTDTPLLNVRLLRAAKPGSVPGPSSDSLGWTPALGHDRAPIHKLQVPPEIRKDHEVWWCFPLPLPECRTDVRFGLLIEEVEVLASDPTDSATIRPSDKSGRGATELVERGPIFSHIVDLGDQSW